jgi:N6-adenosine-specific RNA methylase IME4
MQVDWVEPAPRQRFSTVLADPPWLERGGGQVKRGADRHYPLMSTAAICKLPVHRLAADDAHLYLWVTNNFLPDGLEVMAVWGFRYVTNLAWGKVRDGKVQQGLGQYFRGAHELLLFGVRGKVPYAVTDEGKRGQHPTLVLEPRGEHSAKPEVFHRIIERVSPGPYLELFARREVPGWERWGNEVQSTVAMMQGAS